MNKRLAWRYSCEFCKKSGCSGGAMAKHEKHCTLNPQRECRMCKKPKPMVGLVEFAKTAKPGDENAKSNAAALSDEAGGCPACTLAAIRQSGLNNFEIIGRDKDGNTIIEPPAFDFDYKAAKDDWWADHNAERAGDMY